MTSKPYDLLVIGGGSGGVACARRAASYGAKVALVEADRLGGTCVIRGCVPKKLLMYASQLGLQLQEPLYPGWTVKEVRFDMATWQQAKKAEIDRLEGIYERMLANSGVEVIRGYAKILDAQTVQVGQQTLRTSRMLIATGGKPNQHAFPGLEHAPTSNELLDLAHLPRHVGIAGAGYIALEFACILRGLGVEVSVFYRADLPLRGFDHSIRERLVSALTEQGINLHPLSECKSLKKFEGGYELETAKGMHTFDWFLNATGRSPNVEGLGLESLGIEQEDNGAIVVDMWNQTSAKGVYAVGDVTDRVNLTPVAIAQGRALAENEFNNGQLTVDHAAVASATFTTPPIGSVGMTEDEAANWEKVRVYEAAFRPMKTAFAGGQQQTYMKMLVDDASDRVLGFHMLGDDAPEMIQLLGALFKAGVTKSQLDQTVAVHPTSAEEWVLMRDPVRVIGG